MTGHASPCLVPGPATFSSRPMDSPSRPNLKPDQPGPLPTPLVNVGKLDGPLL